jgi:hypothetical protein
MSYDPDYQKQYWIKNKKKITKQRELTREARLAYGRDYYKKHQKQLIKYMAKWRKANKDRIHGYWLKEKAARKKLRRQK